MVGYSGTPLAQKLGLKPGARLRLLRAPEDFALTLGALPDAVTIVSAAKSAGPFDVIVAFVRTRAELSKCLPRLRLTLHASGGLWIAWPKKSRNQSTSIVTDLSETQVRELGLATGLVDNKVCAIDEVWSGLRFVVRLADRANHPVRIP